MKINSAHGKKYGEFFYRWIGTASLLPVVLYLVVNGGRFIFIDYLNLLIHEGGHGIFMVFGGFIYFLGGTLMQLIIPGMFVIYYISKRKMMAAQVFLVWLGQNLLNISIYAADAQARSLPLLGGNKVFHDWNWMLRRIGLLEYDSLVGSFFYLLGIIVFFASLLLPLILKEYKNSKITLEI